MNAEKFRELALNAIAEISERGKRALVVGGSGLYLKALTHGLAPLPPIDPELRAQLERTFARGIEPRGLRRLIR